MYTKMLKKELKSNKAINISLCMFITLGVMLISGALCIIAETTGAMGDFFEKAKPIHYMQMVSGDIDYDAIDKFASSNELMESFQVLELLGVDNSYIYFGNEKEPYTDSNIENMFTVQSQYFDFLLDENNIKANVDVGQVMIPVYIAETHNLKAGDMLYIRQGGFEMSLTVKGYIRDSQMNPSLVSSKRFLVNEQDYAALKANTGETESLIEFLLTDISKTGEFGTAYVSAGLKSGIEITLAALQLMNALTGGLAAVALILASIILIAVALMCVRFTIVTAMEEDYREIGVMKAIGTTPTQISKLYKTKYFLFSAFSSILGFILSLFFSTVFTKSVSMYMGKADISIWTYLLPFLGVVIVFLIIVWFCSNTLRKLRKVSVVEAIRGNSTSVRFRKKAFSLHKRRFSNVNILLGIKDVFSRWSSYMTPIIIFILCVFLVVVPTNFLNTLESKEFINYTGVGYCDVLITLRYSEDISSRYLNVLDILQDDNDVSKYTSRVTSNYKVKNPDGNYENMSIQSGDFSSFSISYIEGTFPQLEDEIALSMLNAKNFNCSLGDSIDVIVNDKVTSLRVSGIYQDLTNGGKSAQAKLEYNSKDVLWYAVLLNLTGTTDKIAKIEQYSEIFNPAKVVGIEGYISETTAPLIRQFKTVTIAISILSVTLACLITALFIKMISTKDKEQITIMKGLGFSSLTVRTQYISAIILSLLVGVVIGTIAANTLGEGMIGVLLSSMGASKISFIINPLISFLIYPILLLLAVVVVTLITTLDINRYDNYIILE